MLRGVGGRGEVAVGDLGLDERGQDRGGEQVVAAHDVEPTMQLGDRDRRLAAREEQRRSRDRHLGQVLETRDQLVGLLEPALRDADRR